MKLSGILSSAAVAILSGWAGSPCLQAANTNVDVSRDILPILSQNCFHCHGQDPKHRGGELRLDVREEAVAVRDGSAAIVPGDPEKSDVIRRILSKDPEVVMPPPDAHMPAMSSAQIDTLKRWIKAAGFRLRDCS